MSKKRNLSNTSNKPNRVFKFPHFSDIFKEEEPPILGSPEIIGD